MGRYPKHDRLLPERLDRWLLLRLPVEQRIRIKFRSRFGRFPDLANPRTFSEKLQARKLNPGDITRFVDKVLVKDFVRERVGDRYVIPTLFHGPALPPLAERDWKPPFVIKANHLCGGNIFVREEPDWSVLGPEAERLLRVDYGAFTGELFYAQVERQLLVEPLIGSGGALPTDYKFFMFDGKLACIQVDLEREKGHQRIFMDANWAVMPVRQYPPVPPVPPPRPPNLDEMIRVAGELSRGWDFIRIDLYDTGEQMFFGEMTFVPAAGFKPFVPESFDEELGRMWR